MRKIAQEVTKAVAQQGTAARDVLKASQNAQPSGRAGPQVGRANRRESAAEIVSATESMRRGAASTTRALAEQATASEQIVKATDALTKMIASVSRGMSEQAVAATQVTSAVESMRKESDQAARAIARTGARDERHFRRRRRTSPNR